MNWLKNFALIGVLPGDDPDERLRKKILTICAALITVMATGWTATYAALGLWVSAAIPGSYQILVVASLIHLAITKRYSFFRASQLLAILLLPFALQSSLGGFHASGAVMVWAFLCPAGALVFAGTRPAVGWMVAYLALTALAGLAEPSLAGRAAVMPEALRVAFLGMNIACVSLVTFIILYYQIAEREMARAALVFEHRLLQSEQDKSERLLHNILPPAIAIRLKDSPEAIADHFDEVTVLFSDIVGFTTFSSRVSPAQLVAFLNEVFSLIDRLAERHGLEKIKTIGDAYMAVAGLPEPRADHARAAARMAIEMRDGIARLTTPTGEPLRVRIGLHSGPVVAGVIGRKKFAYDLWGDAVNTASRMESHGVPGAIHVSQAVADRLADGFVLESRGSMEIKGKGPMTTFLLHGLNSPA